MRNLYGETDYKVDRQLSDNYNQISKNVGILDELFGVHLLRIFNKLIRNTSLYSL